MSLTPLLIRLKNKQTEICISAEQNLLRTPLSVHHCQQYLLPVFGNHSPETPNTLIHQKKLEKKRPNNLIVVGLNYCVVTVLINNA
jgi:hypothetical protein